MSPQVCIFHGAKSESFSVEGFLDTGRKTVRTHPFYRGSLPGLSCCENLPPPQVLSSAAVARRTPSSTSSSMARTPRHPGARLTHTSTHNASLDPPGPFQLGSRTAWAVETLLPRGHDTHNPPRTEKPPSTPPTRPCLRLRAAFATGRVARATRASPAKGSSRRGTPPATSKALRRSCASTSTTSATR